jgi:hypothetical protein
VHRGSPHPEAPERFDLHVVTVGHERDQAGNVCVADMRLGGRPDRPEAHRFTAAIPLSS